jgi:NADH-quinone oxidoreductase subunit H
MKFGWKVLIPVSLAWIMVVSTLRVMSQQGSSRFVVLSFTFSVVLIYLAVTSAMEKAKLKVKEKSIVTDSPEPSFPVPAIPKNRTDEING